MIDAREIRDPAPATAPSRDEMEARIAQLEQRLLGYEGLADTVRCLINTLERKHGAAFIDEFKAEVDAYYGALLHDSEMQRPASLAKLFIHYADPRRVTFLGTKWPRRPAGTP